MKLGEFGGTRLIKNDNGTSAVEFALVLPILLLMLFGIIEFGVLLCDKAVLTNASREGARAGICFQEPRPTTAEIAQVVDDWASANLISFRVGGASLPDTSTEIDGVAADSSGLTSGQHLTVAVTYDYDFLTLHALTSLFGDGLPGLVTLTSVTTMRAE